MKSATTANSSWPCSWEAHELEELQEGMRLSLREKLMWLEDATEFLQKIEIAPRCAASATAE